MNVEKAARYHRLKRRAAVAGTLLNAAVLLTLLITGAVLPLRLRVSALLGVDAAVSPPAVVGAYALMLSGILQAASLPVAFYSGVWLERRYGLSSESATRWLRDHGKAAVLTAVIALAAAEYIYFTIRRWPGVWWVPAAIGCGAVVLLIARVAPVALLPLFYRFKPLDRPQLQARLRRLSQAAGTSALGVYEWGLGQKTRRANAALVGVGRTRRILLSDTLLAEYSDDEIEVILAHELAHHAHRDVMKSVAAQTIVLLVAFGIAAVVLRVSGASVGIAGAADVAGLPLILLVLGVVSAALTPFINLLSRAHERRADEYALRLTGRPVAFVSAMKRLAAQNLAEPQPSRVSLWLFHSHPPFEERIERARMFEASE
jgi:STE24 endopeptidase